MDFNLWGWASPVAWAIFLVGAGGSAVLLGLGLKLVSSAVESFVKLDSATKRRR